MGSAITVLPVLGVIFVSTFIRSAIGFGNALLAMPLLALLIGIHTATPLVALLSATVALAILRSSWRTIAFRDAWRLVAISLTGIPIGMVLLTAAPEQLVQAGLGVLLIAYGLYSLLGPELPAVRSERLAYLFGFVAGVLGGAYNTNGPPIVIYGVLRRWSPVSFRATLQCYFLITGLFILAGHALAGLWTADVLRLYLYGLPPLALGTLLGGWTNHHLSGEIFRRVVYLFLVATGVICLL